MNDNVPTPPEPREQDAEHVDPDRADAQRRLIKSLDPQDDAGRGLLLALAVLLDHDRLHRLAGMVERRVLRAGDDGFDRGYRAGREDK